MRKHADAKSPVDGATGRESIHVVAVGVESTDREIFDVIHREKAESGATVGTVDYPAYKGMVDFKHL